MVDNVLLSNESEIYIRCMEPQKLNDIGNKAWLEFHNRLQKINQQAILEATEIREESIKELLTSYNKIYVLVQETICISVWRTKILPQLLKIETEPQTTFLLYTVLYHEALCIALLETVLFYPESIVSLEDSALDLFDYIYESISYLVTIKHDKKEIKVEDNETTLSELNRQKDDLLFDIGIRSVSILRYFADNLQRLPLSVSSRMFTTYDIPLLLIELLNKAPWCKYDSKNKISKYLNSKWTVINEEDIIKITQTEAQIWLALHQILLNQTFISTYELTDFRKTQLIKIKQFYLNSGYKKWKSIAKAQATWFFIMNEDKKKELAELLSEAYNTDFLLKLEDVTSKICATCGNKGIKKCSQCKNEWYCGRECQVKHWNTHKKSCSVPT